jgi:hypothetical protein
MAHRADSENTPARPALPPPRPLSSQARGDLLLQRWRLARAAALRLIAGELNPLDVLIDLLGGADFDHEILNPEAAARIIIERLEDAGFKIVPTTREDHA